jgi:hypothetical protein
MTLRGLSKMPLYILLAAIIGLSIYLKSAIVAVAVVALWGLSVADRVLNQKNKDAEILGLIERMNKIEKEHKTLSLDIGNVAERAKTILGEIY